MGSVPEHLAVYGFLATCSLIIYMVIVQLKVCNYLLLSFVLITTVATVLFNLLLIGNAKIEEKVCKCNSNI